MLVLLAQQILVRYFNAVGCIRKETKADVSWSLYSTLVCGGVKDRPKRGVNK